MRSSRRSSTRVISTLRIRPRAGKRPLTRSWPTSSRPSEKKFSDPTGTASGIAQNAIPNRNASPVIRSVPEHAKSPAGGFFVVQHFYAIKTLLSLALGMSKRTRDDVLYPAKSPVRDPHKGPPSPRPPPPAGKLWKGEAQNCFRVSRSAVHGF